MCSVICKIQRNSTTATISSYQPLEIRHNHGEQGSIEGAATLRRAWTWPRLKATMAFFPLASLLLKRDLRVPICSFRCYRALIALPEPRSSHISRPPLLQGLTDHEFHTSPRRWTSKHGPPAHTVFHSLGSNSRSFNIRFLVLINVIPFL